jgi:SAM-dependent methyltransferase
MERSNLSYWNALAQGWAPAPPLSPSVPDLAWYQSWVDRMAARPGALLLLGVTPGIARLARAPDTLLVALDWSDAMLRGTCPPEAARVRGDWRELPIGSRRVALILGDGCYSALGSIEGTREMNRQMHRVLAVGGMACLRCFVRPARDKGVAAFVAETREGPRMRFDLFRWRLAMSVHGARRWGVALGEVWEAWNRVADRAALVARHAWSAEEVARLERWKNATARYSFASLDELAHAAAPWFDVVERVQSTQPVEESFPCLAMRART